MAEHGRIDIRAYLHDHLSPGLRKVEDKLKDVKKASEEQIKTSKKAAYQASKEGKEWEKLAKAQRLTYDEQTKRWRQGGKFISQSKVEALQARAHARAVADLQTKMQRLGNAYLKLEGFLTRGAMSSAKRARAWERIVKVYTAGAQRVTAAHTKMVVQSNMALGWLQGMWTKTTQKISAAQTRLVNGTKNTYMRMQAGIRRFGTNTTNTFTAMSTQGGRAFKATAAGLGVVAAAARQADRDMLRLAKTAAKPLAYGYGGAAVGAGIAAGAAGWMGMTRINQLEAADVKLDVMGHAEGTRADILESVNETVLGTFVTLGEGAGMATSQLGAGVDPAGIEERLQTVVDTASLYSPTDPMRVSMILAQIQAKGKLQGDEILQLAELGAPAYDWIAQAEGIDKSQVSDLVASGNYTADKFFAAMQPRVEGGAKKMGDTFMGSWLKLKAAWARTGEAFMRPLLGPLRKGMGHLTDWLNWIKKWTTQLGFFMAVGLDAAFDKLPKLGYVLQPLGFALKVFFASLVEVLPGLMDGFIAFAGIVSVIAVPVLTTLSTILQMLSPFMWAIVPALLALAHAAAGLFILVKLIKLFDRTKTGLTLVKTTAVNAGKAMGVTRVQTGRLTTAFHGFRQKIGNVVAGRNGLTGLNRNLMTTGSNMNRTNTMARRAAGGLAAVAASMGAIALAEGSQAGLDSEAFTTAWGADSMNQATKQLTGAEFANGNGNSMLNGLAHSPKFESIGGAYANFFNADPKQRADNWIMRQIGKFGQFQTPMDQLKDALRNSVEPELTNQYAEDPEGAKARYGSIREQFLGSAPGASEQDLLDLMPKWKALKERDGFFAGGYTGNGPAGAPAGIVHGREFVTNHWATGQLEAATPGGLAYANATGQWPTSGDTFAPQIHINAGPGSDPQAIAAAVRAELERQAARMKRQYGTRELRGAR